jgi:hypothetical protein
VAPVVAAGRPEGIFAGYLLPIGGAMLLAWSLASGPSGAFPARGGAIAATVAAGAAGFLVVRYMTSPTLVENSPVGIFAATAAITLVPAIRSVAGSTDRRLQAEYLSVALVPLAAMAALTQSNPQPAFPLLLLGAVLGWQLVPSARVVRALGTGWAAIRPARAGGAPVAPAGVGLRNGLLVGLLGLIGVSGPCSRAGAS